MARPRAKRKHAPPACGLTPHPPGCKVCAAARARQYRKLHKPTIAERRALTYMSLDPQEKKQGSRLNAVAVLVRRGTIVRGPCEFCHDHDVRAYFASPDDPARAVRWLCHICIPYADELPPIPQTPPRARKHRRAPTTCRNGHPRLSHGPCPTCRNERMARYRRHQHGDRLRRRDRQRKRTYRASPRYQLLRARSRIATAVTNRAIPAPWMCENDPCRNTGKFAAVLDLAEEARAPLRTGWWWMCQPCAAQWIATYETIAITYELPTITAAAAPAPAPAGKILDEADLARIDEELSAFDKQLESIITRIKAGPPSPDRALLR